MQTDPQNPKSKERNRRENTKTANPRKKEMKSDPRDPKTKERGQRHNLNPAIQGRGEGRTQSDPKKPLIQGKEKP